MFLDVGPETALPRCGVACFEVKGREVLVVRSEAGLFACAAICTHENAGLADGLVLADTLECPLHGAVFNLRTGVVEFGPAEEPLPVYAVKQENGRLLVDLPELTP
jgi:3-phenylpropionate/trans-cinnamate dioxygenase ferredoxin subunit